MENSFLTGVLAGRFEFQSVVGLHFLLVRALADELHSLGYLLRLSRGRNSQILDPQPHPQRTQSAESAREVYRVRLATVEM
jgi:hypothetical protein